MTTSPTYSLGSEEQERERLIRQARLLDAITAGFLEEAGLAEGMRVLDVGCGLGDVALLAGRIVGPQGEVVAIDSDPRMLSAAERVANELREEIQAAGGVIVGPPMIGAWTTTRR
jgi:ubiquinone/menaquinone biosynthesis C-methylase UbiE